MTNYDVTRVERKTAELLVIDSSVQKRAQNREKTTSGELKNVYLKLLDWIQVSHKEVSYPHCFSKRARSEDAASALAPAQGGSGLGWAPKDSQLYLNNVVFGKLCCCC